MADRWHAPLRPPFNGRAEPDAIRHFAHAAGDDRPLHCDPAAAARSRWGGIVAPPLFLWTLGEVVPGDEPVDVESLPVDLALGPAHGERWTFARPVRPGDRVRLRWRAVDPVGGRPCFEHAYLTPDGDPVASRFVELRSEPWAVGPAEAPTRLAKDDLQRRERALRAEVRHGPGVVAWGSLEVGTRLPPRSRGPLTVTDTVVRSIGIGLGDLTGWGPMALAARHRAAHPDLYQPGGWADAFAAEWHDPASGRVPCDAGRHRTLWMLVQALDWAGDDAWVESYDVEVHERAWEGDVHDVVATVTALPAPGVVELSNRCVDQGGRVTASARTRIAVEPRHLVH